MAKTVKESVTWVGKVDWELRKFHGNEYSTHRGSTYNSYLIREVLDLGLPIDMIATSHGVVWRDNPVQIVEKYMAWADQYGENRITIIYDTMWDGTRIMA